MKKNLLKILLSFFAFFLFTFAIIQPLNMAGNWYQQLLPNIGGRTINDISFTDSLTGYAVTTISSGSSYILKTINSGDNWSINHSVNFIIKRVQFLNPNTGYVGGSGLIKTTNGGANWFDVNLSMVSEDIHFINNDTGWYAYSEGLTGGVFRTINGGVNWTQQLNIGSQNPTAVYFYNRDTGFIADNTLYKTTNSGINWTLIPGGTGFSDMYFLNSSTGYKAGGGTFQKTTNGGLNWVNQPIPQGGNIFISQIIEFVNFGTDTIIGVGSTIITGSGNRGIICRSTNGGNNWTFQVPDSTINIFQYQNICFTSRLQGWAYTGVTGVHTTNGGDPLWYTSVEYTSSYVPKKYTLFQNYPNPFNPATNIKYEIANNSYIRLVIYDTQGKEVISLINAEQRTGIYEVDWNATGFSSGIYFYKLTVTTGKEVYTDTKRMVLIK